MSNVENLELRELRDPNLQELCDAYALGTLDGNELAELRKLLAEVESDAASVERKEAVNRAMRKSEEVVAMLAWEAPLVEPPASLRAKVMEAAAVDAGRMKVVSIKTAPEGRWAGFGSPWTWLGWAAAAGFAIGAIALNTRAIVAERDLAEAKFEAQGLRADLAEQQRVLAVIGAKDSRAIRLVTTAPEAPQFRAYWSESAGLVLTGTGVAAPKPGRTMQLWIVPKNGKPISAGVFEPGVRGEVLLIAANTASRPDLAQALAISDEPVGGSAQPTTQPAWVGAVGGF